MRNVKKKTKTNNAHLKKNPTQENIDGAGTRFKSTSQLHVVPFSALQFVFVCFCLQKSQIKFMNKKLEE